MAELEQAVESRLKSQVTKVSNRVTALHLPQKPTLPALTYQRVDAARESAMSADSGIASARMQVDSWAATYAAAKSAATQVRGALQRFRGTVSSVEILDSFIESDQDIFEEETRLFRVSQDYLVWYRE